MIHIQDLIDKRVRSWSNRHDLDFSDKQRDMLVDYALDTPHLFEELKQEPWLIVELAVNIVDKNGETVPFILNECQEDLKHQVFENGAGVYMVLKGRQQGVTTYVTAVQLCVAIFSRNFRGFTIADTKDNAGDIFEDKAKVVLDRLPERLKPSIKFDSQTELAFSKLNSIWRIGVATPNVGRSKTLNFLHLSEAAFFRCKLTSLMAALGNTATQSAVVIYESTANGRNQFEKLWHGGKYHNIFFVWWRTAEYRDNDTSVLEYPRDEHIAQRIEWLRDKGLEDTQIAWYVKKYNEYAEAGDPDLLKQEYPCTPDEAFISSGSCVFDANEVNQQLDRASSHTPLKRGKFLYKKVYKGNQGQFELTDIEWHDDINGCISIYQEPIVKAETDNGKEDGHLTGRTLKAPYTGGGDTAGEGSDRWVLQVIDNRELNTVACLWAEKMDADVYAEQCMCLGYHYNTALLTIEANYSSEPINHMIKGGYPNLYMRERVDTLDNIIEKKVGFETNKKTRPVIIDELKAIEREQAYKIEPNPETLKEMLTFVWVHKEGHSTRAEASQGSHDDLVMALAIAHWGRNEQGRKDWIIEGEIYDVLDLFREPSSTRKHSGGLKWFSAN